MSEKQSMHKNWQNDNNIYREYPDFINILHHAHMHVWQLCFEEYFR